jgi:hypothetical protein
MRQLQGKRMSPVRVQSHIGTLCGAIPPKTPLSSTIALVAIVNSPCEGSRYIALLRSLPDRYHAASHDTGQSAMVASATIGCRKSLWGAKATSDNLFT